jgi:hypothetical protein
VHHHRVQLPDFGVCSQDGVGDGAQRLAPFVLNACGGDERIVVTRRLDDIIPGG